MSAVCGMEQMGAEEEMKRLEEDPSLVNVDSETVQQVVVLPGGQPIAATKAGDEPLEVSEENMDTDSEAESEEVENFLMEEDEAQESEEEESEEDTEEDSDLSEEDSEEDSSYEEDASEESEEESDDNMYDEGELEVEDDQPLVNVDAREVHQVIVATPKHKKRMVTMGDEWLKDITDNKADSHSEESM
ncbi:hypothetical protein Pmani_003988 [Petrolisthes manimaculis]|uniref:Uncharacterized protein n=1 Tax=Petrolisthes manimaculis TaxID=1843537 RepID=A0AAE1ULZ1_9EUCA|nr:hypothetical protein Pmani_003988 [Petrolisthes manimaculis]